MALTSQFQNKRGQQGHALCTITYLYSEHIINPVSVSAY